MTKIRHWIVIAVFAILGTYCITALLKFFENNTRNIQVVQQGWTVYKNGELTDKNPQEDLSDFSFQSLYPGDVIVLERSLSDVKADEPRMILDTWHVIVNVFLDEELIYTHGQEYADADKMIGNIRHYVDLPGNHQGKTLRIEMTCTERDAMSGMLPIGFTDSHDLSAVWFNRLHQIFLPASILVGAGILLLFGGVLVFHVGNGTYKVIVLGVLLLLVGIYSLCRAQYMGMLVTNPVVYNFMEFLSLYCIPGTMLGLFLGDQKLIRSKYVLWLYRGSFIICVLFAVCSVGGHVLNIGHFPECLTFFYILVFLGVIALIVVILNMDGKNKKALKFYFAAVIALCIGAALAVFAFRLRYMKVWNAMLHVWRWQEYLFLIALIVAGVLVAIGFVIEVRRIIYDSLYSSMYRKIAYTDSLTGLGNRRGFDEELEWLEKHQDSTSYGIACFDLNDLKKCNDTQGHDIGDKMLKSFAEILQKICETEISAYRVGGDEFAVVIRDTRVMDTDEFTKRMWEGIRSANAKHEDIVISSAYGIAKQGEMESVHKVYKLADERMYETKTKMKGTENVR